MKIEEHAYSEKTNQTVGYVRLSRDDDKRNYVSIENQKLLIENYALEHQMSIDKWYEDDGYSGYKFDRPAFTGMINDLADIDTVIAKDLSRLGRHNGKVLILLDEFKERDKRLILIDDRYDTLSQEEDEIIGIKTWMNERYIKDVSKKIQSVIRVRQKEGTLLIGTPIGYNKKGNRIEILTQEAAIIRQIFELYQNGSGYRKIAEFLTAQKIPTPSMLLMKRYLKEGKVYRRKVTTAWSESMVSSILKNDFYIGTLRLHKRARTIMNGKDCRVPGDRQFVFKEHHPPIIDNADFELVQDLIRQRNRWDYRTDTPGHDFAGLLYCRDCQGRMTIIRRKERQDAPCYLCSTYNKKGKRYCQSSHLIYEKDLKGDVLTLMGAILELFHEEINQFKIHRIDHEREIRSNQKEEMQKNMEMAQKQLQYLMKQKITELAQHPNHAEILQDSYSNIQRELTDQIAQLKHALTEFREETSGEAMDKSLKTDLSEGVTRDRICKFIDRIVIDEDGMPDLYLKSEMERKLSMKLEQCLNQEHDEILAAILEVIRQEESSYTTVSCINAALSSRNKMLSERQLLPFLNLCIEKGILRPTTKRRKTYQILVEKEGN